MVCCSFCASKTDRDTLRPSTIDIGSIFSSLGYLLFSFSKRLWGLSCIKDFDANVEKIFFVAKDVEVAKMTTSLEVHRDSLNNEEVFLKILEFSMDAKEYLEGLAFSCLFTSRKKIDWNKTRKMNSASIVHRDYGSRKYFEHDEFISGVSMVQKYFSNTFYSTIVMKPSTYLLKKYKYISFPIFYNNKNSLKDLETRQSSFKTERAQYRF